MDKDKTLLDKSALADDAGLGAGVSAQGSETAVDHIDRINRIAFQRIINRRFAPQSPRSAETPPL